MTEPRATGRRTLREATADWCKCYWIGIVAALVAIVIVIITIVSLGNQNDASAAPSGETLTSADYTQHRGLPRGVPADTTNPVAQWNASRKTFDIVLFGSSTCVAKPTETRVITRTRFSLVLAVPASATVCTADIRPITTRIPAPHGLLPNARIQMMVTVDGPGGAQDKFSVTVD